MIGKLLGKAVGLPVRVASLAVKAGEAVVRAPVDLIFEGELTTPLGDAVQDGARRLERVVEETLDG